MALVNVEQLQVTFGEKTAVSAASFAIEPGETFSLIGESGCGKSTILRVLAGLQRQWHGSIQVLGDRLQPGMRFTGALRRNVQMVFQDPWASLHPNHTLSRTLGEPLQIHGETQIAEKVAEALQQVGLTADAGKRYPHQLSGGQRQRVAIARALLLRPQLLLLDEPTSALDIAHQVDVLALVHRLSQQRGLTVIAVLHDINMAARYCDYLVALRGGEMIAQGTPAQLMRSETLEQIYGIPMGILPHPAGSAPVSFVY